MSNAKKGKPIHNKGKVYCYSPKTHEKGLYHIDDIPTGWSRGYLSTYLKKVKNA